MTTLARHFALLATAAALLATPAAAQNATLKSSISVSDALVRIGDLVDNAGATASIAVFRAPDLGQTGSVPAARVVEALRAHKLAVDAHGIGDVTVTRLSRAVAPKEIESRIVESLSAHQSLSDGAQLTLKFDGEVRTLHLDRSATGELSLARMNYEPRSGRFDVSVALPADQSGRRTEARFTGTAVETIEVPILARPLQRGEMVKAADFIEERRPRSEIASGMVMRATDAVGRAARRILRAGQTVRQSDLMRPEIVQRGETVTIVFEVPGIMLTARGKAADAGAEGDVINVLNMQSKRTVQATVTGLNRVTVTSALRPALVSAAALSTVNPE